MQKRRCYSRWNIFLLEKKELISWNITEAAVLVREAQQLQVISWCEQGLVAWVRCSFEEQNIILILQRGGQPVHGHIGTHSQGYQQREELEKLRSNSKSQLLSPEDLVGKQSHQNAGRSSSVSYSSYVSSSNICRAASQLPKTQGRQGILVCLHQEVKNQSFILDLDWQYGCVDPTDAGD